MATGLASSAGINISPQIQVIVSHVVPEQRIGEAFGSLACVTQSAGILAPLFQIFLLKLVLPFLPKSWNQTVDDPQTGLMVFWCLAMLCSWPFAVLLHARLREGASDVWVSQRESSEMMPTSGNQALIDGRPASGSDLDENNMNETQQMKHDKCGE